MPERGARLARREERAYRAYSSDEQRRQNGAPAARSLLGGVETGCPARQMSAYFVLGMLGCSDAMVDPTTIGRYEVVQRLGQGGMGTVFLARDPHLERTLAIKVLSVDRNDEDDELRGRFAREARSAAALKHPNIVTIYDIGEDGGRAFIAMEYVSGESLAGLIRRRAEMTVQRKVRLMQQLCAGLAYAHKAGLIHRDIKPSNIIFVRGQTKLADIGLVTGINDAKSFVGTEGYIAPEGPGTPAAPRSLLCGVERDPPDREPAVVADFRQP